MTEPINKKGYILSIATIVIVLLIFFFSKDKTGYVDNNKLYKEFKGTKDLEEKLQSSLSGDRNTIDSLNKVIAAIESMYKTKNPTVEELSLYKKLVVFDDSLKYVYQTNIQNINSKISIQSWNTLNEYILEYGKKKNYKYIFGASGNGSLMYASDKKDITDELIKYANKKYEGN